jgi:hypothetical protein
MGRWTEIAQRSVAIRKEFAQQLNEVKGIVQNLPSRFPPVLKFGTA